MLKKLLFVTILLTVVLVLPVLAAAPQTINFQGRLTDNVGDPITDPVDVTFIIYTLGGSPVWTEIWNTG
ncbi:hypothetical protein ACFLZ2_06220, partial [Candidatus Margulisiibacteriota bacterium]